MAYVLECIVAATGCLRSGPAFANGVVVDLGQGLGLMPMTDALFDEVRQGDEVDPRFASTQRFPPGFDGVLAAWSGAGPLAYLEAEYFGGTGSQFAAVWHDGVLVLGPLTAGENARGRSPISQALRRLGVSAVGFHDEFDAVRLGRHRRTEDWAPV